MCDDPAVLTDSARNVHVRSVAQFPVLFLLATKNNMLSALVGKSYVKLNFIHRFAGRSVIVCSVLHSALYVKSRALPTFIHAREPAHQLMQLGVAPPRRTRRHRQTGLRQVSNTKHRSSRAGRVPATPAHISPASPARRVPPLPGLAHHRVDIAPHRDLVRAPCRSVVRAYQTDAVLRNACWPNTNSMHVKWARPWILVSLGVFALDVSYRLVGTRVRTARLVAREGGVTQITVDGLGSGWRAGQHVWVRRLTARHAWEGASASAPASAPAVRSSPCANWRTC